METEAVVFGTRAQTDKIDTSDGINVAGTIVKFSSRVKLLVVTWRWTQPCQWINASLTSYVAAAITSGRCGTLSDDGCRQDDSSRSRLRPFWLRQRATAGHNGEEPGPTAGGWERSCQSCLSGSAFFQCNWSAPLPSLAADTTENWLQYCHDYIQSQTDQHTGLHFIIDQWLHPITNFTIIWQVTVVPICHYSDNFTKDLCFWLTYHLEHTSVLLSIWCNFNCFKHKLKRFYLPQHTDLFIISASDSLGDIWCSISFYRAA